jgi:hypothetical protein
VLTIAANDWQAIQFFLDDEPISVAEVAISSTFNPRTGLPVTVMRCTCKGYRDGEGCRHVTLVAARMKETGGAYRLQLKPCEVDLDVIREDPKAYRELVLNHSVIEVISAGG